MLHLHILLTKLFTAVVLSQCHDFSTPSPVLGDLDPPTRVATAVTQTSQYVAPFPRKLATVAGQSV